MADPHPIEVDALSKTYRDGALGRRRIEAVREVSFQVRTGEIFGLLGPNGAGKTTMIKMLLGIVRKTKGRASLLGHPIGHRASRRRVGYLPESHRMPLHHTGNSALAYYGKLSGMSAAQVRTRSPEMLEMVGLEEWGGTRIKKYSKGMMQRLGLAQAMLHDPDILILDEPTDGVDPVGRRKIRSVLSDLKNRGKTVFLNSHLLQEIELICDRVVILQHGVVLSEGDVSQMTQQDANALEMRIAASEADIRSALKGKSIATLTPAEPGIVRVTLQAPSQTDTDACIDALRARGLSIVSVARTKQTLEDVFLKVVDTSGEV